METMMAMKTEATTMVATTVETMEGDNNREEDKVMQTETTLEMEETVRRQLFHQLSL